MTRYRFLKTQKILRISTIDKRGIPHIVPVWYEYVNGKFYVGTNTSTKKARNIRKNSRVGFCIDAGVRTPNIFGIMGTGKANLILDKKRVSTLAKKILRRYFQNLNNKSAQELLADTDCIIEIVPKKITTWKF